MDYTLLAGLLAGFVMFGGDHQHPCLFVDPLPPSTTNLASPAPGQHQQLDQLSEPPLQRCDRKRFQCGQQPLLLLARYSRTRHSALIPKKTLFPSLDRYRL